MESNPVKVAVGTEFTITSVESISELKAESVTVNTYIPSTAGYLTGFCKEDDHAPGPVQL